MNSDASSSKNYKAELDSWRDASKRPVSAAALREADVQVGNAQGSRAVGEWLTSPDMDFATLQEWLPEELDPASDAAVEIHEDILYAPYLARQDAELQDVRTNGGVAIARGFPFDTVPGLSNEMVERLSRSSPPDLAAAGRVPGDHPRRPGSIVRPYSQARPPNRMIENEAAAREYIEKLGGAGSSKPMRALHSIVAD